jgi:predicted nicotinamide N-methyase
MIYQTHVVTQRFAASPGLSVPLELTIECLRDLDQTIDDLFIELSKTGDASLLEERCPYFGKVWPSALALSEWILEKAELFKNSKVLELGCGLAIPSFVVAKLGAEVTATDFHPDVPEFLKKNLELNKTHIHYEKLNWAESSHSKLAERSFNWIIGSDVLYERTHGSQLSATLAHLVRDSGCGALIADPGRPYLQGFTEELKHLNMEHRTHIRGDIFLIEVNPQEPKKRQ